MAIWHYKDQAAKFSGADGTWLSALSYLMSPGFVRIQIALNSEDRKVVLYRTSARFCLALRRADLVKYIDDLQPITAAKLADPVWKAKVLALNEQIPYLRIRTNNDVVVVQKRQEAPRIPGFTVEGLPGFDYPNIIHPPLVAIEAPSSIATMSGSAASEGGPSGGGTPPASYSYNVPSKGLGDPRNLVNMAASPLLIKKGWSCFEIPTFRLPNFKFKLPKLDFSFKVTVPKFSLSLPSLNIDVAKVLSLPPCIAQHIPPMMLPRVSIPSISLGGGAEFGLFKNGKKVADNFGKGFKPTLPKIPKLANNPLKQIKGAVNSVQSALNKINGTAAGYAAQAMAIKSTYDAVTKAPVQSLLKGIPSIGQAASTVNSLKDPKALLKQMASPSISQVKQAAAIVKNPLASLNVPKISLPSMPNVPKLPGLLKTDSLGAIAKFSPSNLPFSQTAISKAISGIGQIPKPSLPKVTLPFNVSVRPPW